MREDSHGWDVRLCGICCFDLVPLNQLIVEQMLQPKIDVPISILKKRIIKSYILLRFIHFSMRMFMNYHQDVLIFYAHLCRRSQFRTSYIDRLIVHVYMSYHWASSHLVTNAVKRSKTDSDKPRWIYSMCPSSTWLQAGKPLRLRQPWLTRQTSQ